MSSVLVGHEERAVGATGRGLRNWILPHTWNVRQRRSVYAATAGISAILAGLVCTAGDLAGLRAAEARLTEAEQMRSEAQRSVARLPALRAAGASRQTPRLPADSPADDIRWVSEAASRSGLSLLSLEPSVAGGTAAGTFRTLKLVARGSFSQLRGFLAALSGAPGLIVPSDVTIKRGGGEGLSLTAALQVFGHLPALPLADPADVSENSQFDPFADRFTTGAGAGVLRLAGIMQDGAGIVALVETASGTEAVRAGQSFGSGRVERVAPLHVTLSSSAGSQTLGWVEEAK
jgi:type II secretory pathway component PulM